MANALVVRKTQLPASQKKFRAAQYLRMSTDRQRYSIENQAAAIAAYAQQHNLSIVRTYRDEGESGLKIRNRAGLTQLIDDVNTDDVDFTHILVYDVSRWGRFQDIDESAHYEFVCKQSGIQVTYCAEQFDNDGSLLSSIVKNIKRVMAAEYSRELSVKVHAGQSRIAALGFRVGGPMTFGLRREMVDETQRSRGWLVKGERKSLQTDRVRLCIGSENESALVRWIFQQFVVERQSYSEIARRLNKKLIPNKDGGVWTDGMISTILKNENYVGNIVYNRTSRRLGQKMVRNPSSQWIRRESALDPIVDQKLFALAQKMMTERRLEISEDEMLLRLRILLKRKGELNSSLINDTPGIPCISTLCKHFGSLRKAFSLIGYKSKRDCDWLDTKDIWSGVLAKHATKVAETLRSNLGIQVNVDAGRASITVKGNLKITFLTARQAPKAKPWHATHWKLYRRKKTSGLLVVLRLDDVNRDVADYVVMPAHKMKGPYLWLSATTMISGAIYIRTFPQLIREIGARSKKRIWS